MRAAAKLCVSDCVAERVRSIIPQRPAEGQRIGNQIDAAFIFARAYFVCAFFCVDKVEDSGLKLFGNKLRALTGAERRLMEAVLISCNIAPG